MRVEGPHGSFGDTPPREKVGDKKKAGSSSRPAPYAASFVAELQNAIADDVSEPVDFDELIRSVDESGRDLVDRPDAEHLKNYKSSVKRFVLAAVRRAYRVKLVESRTVNPKLYVFVEKIEVKIDQITRTVLASHRNPLRLLSQLEELRGLLLDLRM